ncbi:MAG: hypothetical protein A3J97_13375 [Spirochaetes bacterium RIFOXYC1_FULL_54_7]|nr:MAG: hypothetical protein A3J97_13375 [Spirochaetes bacterium RIFOXYC1_FULL_54_7]
MAKIDLPDNLLAGLIPGLTGRRPEKKREAAKLPGSFKSRLREAGDSDGASSIATEPYSQAEAAELLDAVHSFGESLRKDPNPDNIKAYKKAVRNFVHYVVENAYELNEQTSGRNIMKRKKYTTVVVVDEKLERLAADLMSSQRDRLDILRRLDEIHGLLVDLLR